MKIKMNSPKEHRVLKAVVLDGQLYTRNRTNPRQTTCIDTLGGSLWNAERLEDIAECVNAQPIYGGDSITLTF